MILNGKQSKQSLTKALVLSLIIISCFAFYLSFASAEYSDCTVYGNCKPTGISNINNSYLNQTINNYNTTFNTTQFDTSIQPIGLNLDWFFEWISQYFYTKSEVDSLVGGSELIVGGFYYSSRAGTSKSQTLPFNEDPVEYFNLSLTQTPTTTGVNVNLTNGTITILTNGTYQIDYSFNAMVSTTAQLKDFGVRINSNNATQSYAPIFTRVPTTNMYLNYKQTEYFNLVEGDYLDLYFSNGGGTGTATTMVFTSVSLEVRKL